MRQFIRRALQKLSKLTQEQTRALLVSADAEIDRLEAVLDSLADGILVCGVRNELILANKNAGRFFPAIHHHNGEGNEPVWNFIPDEKLADFMEKTLVSGDKAEEKEFDVELLGLQRLLSVSILPLVRDYKVSGSLIYLEDITEKRAKEARLRRMENLASLTTLAAGVAHEIKNPLGSISIHVQLIQKVMDANKALYFNIHPEDKGTGLGPDLYFSQFDRHLGVVNEEIDRLNHIVVDFLFAVRPMNVDLRPGNINILITEMIEFVGFEMEDAQIACELELAEKIPEIEFDERFMKQALLNLINNAKAAMPSGGILKITTEARDAEVAISVSDTGTGISDANLSKIFEPYFTTKDNGSGLGLTLVYKIIREHRGEVTVKSHEGEGASFTITLPVPQKDRRLISYDPANQKVEIEEAGEHEI
ncbi:PAS domain-containing sensor histidine kinase [Spirochaetia bacterium]|nr:PAS domain-containing sensor histidine kinase [Spirochaetia bacterium]